MEYLLQSPISELSDSEASSPSPGTRRQRSVANRISAASSDDEAPRPNPVSLFIQTWYVLFFYQCKYKSKYRQMYTNYELILK